ncbi:hypothetical protein IWX90DRAFT_382915 [Phyllosticta citrichinensis]|uniref:Uncharacterized protein n=1 Tax=Phyllosticta citrichinensis TaxID=1130410 RepID=A0ABR1XW75_9PEZI
MPGQKDRLYVALYLRGASAPNMPGGEDKYHWALLVGPKAESRTSEGTRYHVKQVSNPKTRTMEWQLEERLTTVLATNALLVRIMIGKVEKKSSLVDLIRGTPIRHSLSGWNCVEWVREAILKIQTDRKAIGTSVLEWRQVRDDALLYCERKKNQHRFDGRGTFDMEKAATYDLIEGKETIP